MADEEEERNAVVVGERPKRKMREKPRVFPPGFRFQPTDEELVLQYLMRKMAGLKLPYNSINEVNIYAYHPKQLVESYEQWGEDKWYFFTPRVRKYSSGDRPNRTTGCGFWKATGTDKEVYNSINNKLIATVKALVFYQGNTANSVMTEWVMHEYKVKDTKESQKTDGTMKMNVCYVPIETKQSAEGGPDQEINQASGHQVLPKNNKRSRREKKKNHQDGEIDSNANNPVQDFQENNLEGFPVDNQHS